MGSPFSITFLRVEATYRREPLHFLTSRESILSVNKAIYNHDYNVHTIAIVNIISKTMRIARSARDRRRRTFVRMRALSI